jgi:hypothetical protein
MRSKSYFTLPLYQQENSINVIAQFLTNNVYEQLYMQEDEKQETKQDRYLN